MSEHTPGPWEIVEEEGSYTIANPMIDSDSGAEMYDPVVWEMGGIDNLANARLIAAAPDLLAAAQLALHKIEQTLAGQYTDGMALSAALTPLYDAVNKALSND